MGQFPQEISIVNTHEMCVAAQYFPHSCLCKSLHPCLMVINLLIAAVFIWVINCIVQRERVLKYWRYRPCISATWWEWKMPDVLTFPNFHSSNPLSWDESAPDWQRVNNPIIYEGNPKHFASSVSSAQTRTFYCQGQILAWFFARALCAMDRSLRVYYGYYCNHYYFIILLQLRFSPGL